MKKRQKNGKENKLKKQKKKVENTKKEREPERKKGTNILYKQEKKN